ncbi:MAG: hypothetical protein ABFR62_13280 [Bacteroidota bacterium]
MGVTVKNIIRVLTAVLIISLFSIRTYSQDKEQQEEKGEKDKGHMFSPYKIHNPDYTWTNVVRFLGAKSMFYTAVLPVHKNAVVKPEILFGDVNETTFWYSFNFALVKSLKIGFFLGPGISYSFDSGQGARVRWQYGFGTPNLTDDIPISLFLLSNITYDFNSETETWDWYNFGIAYQLNERVKIQIDMEGNYLGDPFVQNNIGFVVDF